MKTAPESLTTVVLAQVADLQEKLGISPRGSVSVRDRLGSNGSSTGFRLVAVITSCLLHLGLIVLLLLPTDEWSALQVNRDAQPQTYPNQEQLTTVFSISDDTQQLSDTIPAQTALLTPLVLSGVELDLAVTEPELRIEARLGEVTSADRDRAALATRVAYLSQIQARIERTWDHPLVSLDHSFHCQVKIQQTLQGEIKAMKISNCDGDDVWQQSLLRAVRNAAPFPAPRDEQSFVEELTLDFKTEPVSLAALFTLLETLPDNSKAQIPQNLSLKPQVY